MNHSNNSADLKPSATVRNISTQDGAVLLDINQGLCFSMNPVGAKIWEMLKMNHPVDRVADTLASEFSVPREQVLEDVRAFMAQLESQHLLVSDPKTDQRSTGLFQRLLRRARASK